MGIRYIDRLCKSQQNWKNYDKFKNQVEGNGLFNKLVRPLIFDKDEKAIFKKHHLKVGELYNSLENMIRERKIDPSLYMFQTDAIIYRFPELLGRKDLSFQYWLGIDFCISGADEWKILRKIGQTKRLGVETWRLHHASLVKKLEELENPKEILDAILEFSESHDKVFAAANTLHLLSELYPDLYKLSF